MRYTKKSRDEMNGKLNETKYPIWIPWPFSPRNVLH